ncbi:DNA polymerase III subunit alpha [Candidatus Bipolaricaulota bacterium]|nr:DNA polymerase III subunit alpha [Candidatus Bipolaricaulota bacterium]
MTEQFVHLHTHSEYSILDSSCKIAVLLDRATACGMDALALTDHGVMSGVIKFYREAKKREIKPIIGCEIYLAPGDRRRKKAENGQRFHHLVLLAADSEGYRNLLAIVSLAHTEGFYYKPRADKELLCRHHSGLIALSACESGEIPRLLLADRAEDAVTAAAEYADIFGEKNFYLELQDHGTERGKILRKRTIELARRLDLPLVATNDVHYLAPEDRLAHEVLLNIRANKKITDPDRRRFDGGGYHFRTAAEMEELFSDIPEALENTRLIADRCNLEIPLGRTVIPPFPLPGEITADMHLRDLAYEGAQKLYPSITAEVKERLDYELSVIERMEYATSFLIAWDFIRFARDEGIPVGPGRGSAAGSLVSYCTGITRVDPLKYNLIFERFLNPDRISMPDFDIDFCVKGRDRVIAYVQNKYSHEKTSQIATYDRMAARSVIRDVGRVLGVPYGTTDRLAKLIPYGSNLKQALDQAGELAESYKHDETVKQVIDIGRRLEGLTRNSSTHAAGMVMSAEPLLHYVPLLRVNDEEIVTQFDMTDVEAIGLLKFDFLGLRNLTLIDEACRTLRERAGIDIDIEVIPFDDEKTFQMLRDGQTAGIFQLESSGMTALIRRVQPDRFEDLIALLALYRPGPLESGMTDDYAERRNGRQEITYPHPALKDLLEETYGLPIYQDQVMQMAQKLADFTLAEADILRKAMGKKNKEIMAGLRDKFLIGCRKNGIAAELAVQSFSDMEKFSSYGFNKSHTTAYAFISYQTAYLKANYPTYFMASLLASVQGDLDKVAAYIEQCRKMGIEVLPPDINESESSFTPVADGVIRFGLAAIKHVGEGAIHSILAARGDRFTSFFDLCRRIEVNGVDRDTLEALIKAGAFDLFGASRRGLLHHLSGGIEMMQVARQERESGQQSLFDDCKTSVSEPQISEDEFPQSDLLQFEKELLGLYVSAHPLDRHQESLDLYCTPLSAMHTLQKGMIVTIGGQVKTIRRIETHKGEQMAFLSIDDGVAEAEVTAFPSVFERATSLLSEDQLVGLRVSVGERNGERNLIIEETFPLDEVPSRISLAVTLTLKEDEIDRDRLVPLCTLMQENPGTAPVVVRVEGEHGGVEVRAGERFFVTPSTALRERLETLLGKGRISFRRGGA